MNKIQKKISKNCKKLNNKLSEYSYYRLRKALKYSYGYSKEYNYKYIGEVAK